ncbi:hypothetical protein C8R46DRAFT_1220534 [Mycena filopes]|nr:hypothetical protein C8R46DRAFT_1220534 [Mycena filopes]
MTPALSLAARMTVPMDSSPIQAPSHLEDSDPTDLTLPLPRSPLPAMNLTDSVSPLDPPPHLARHKRPARDMTQFADETARAQKLSKTETADLRTFAKMEHQEQLIALAGQLFILQRTLRGIQPADAVWPVPTSLKKRIEEHVGVFMMDSSIAAYRNEDIGAPKLLLDLLIANPSWGYTTDLRSDPSKVDVVDGCIGRVFITARNNFKNILKKSCGSASEDDETKRIGGSNIVTLTENLLKHFKLHKNNRVALNVALCGRIALLRQLVLEKDDNSYWTTVDNYLLELRTNYPDKVQYSRFIKRMVLNVDFELYGQVTLDGLDDSTRRAVPATPTPATPVPSGAAHE